MAMGDEVACRQRIAHFQSSDYTFADSREGKFVEKLLTAWENGDGDGFSEICMEYDTISKLTTWQTSMLVKVKRFIEGNGETEATDADLL
jgi:hypothetical protein